MKKVIYTKVSNDRDLQFGVITNIVQDEDNKYVVKTPSSVYAKEHVQSLVRKYGILKRKYADTPFDFAKVIDKDDGYQEDGSVTLEFVEGESYSNYLDEILENNYVEFLESIKNYFAILYKDEMPFEYTEEFVKIFGNVKGFDGKPAVRHVDIDALFDNIIFANNIWVDYDYEWTFDFLIPVDFLIFRILHYYVNRSPRRLMIKDKLYQEFNISEEKQNIFNDMEDNFQVYVYGQITPMFKLYDSIHGENVNITDCFEELVSLRNIVNLKDNHIHNIEYTNEQNRKLLEMKDNHISNLEDKIAEQEKLEVQCRQLTEANEALTVANEALTQKVQKIYRGIKNPLYGGYCLGRKILRKIKRTIVEAPNKKYEKKYGLLKKGQQNKDYETWIQYLESNYDTKQEFSYCPKISVIIPVYNVLDKHLIPCIESVKNQIYTNWEICIADDASTWDNVKKTLKKYEKNPQIKIVYRKENGHISCCTNSALEVATGEFVTFLDCDDTLSPNALYEVVKKLNEDSSLDFIYSDEDKIDENGNNRHMPHFKPDWSPDTLLSLMYTCHLSVYRKSIVDEIGGLRLGYEGSQDYDFVLRYTEKTKRIAHIPKILYHWREREESTASSADAKPYIIEATRKSKEDALKRRGIDADVVQLGDSNWFRIIYKVIGNPKVSVIIPSKDNYKILERCIRSIYEYTAYKNFEIILIDNGSNEENRRMYSALSEEYGFVYKYEKMDFNFSKMCNMGANIATGDYYLLLNDDTEILEPKWMEILLGQAQQKHIGAVGAKLLYPDKRTIQHIGVINITPGPIHAFTKCLDEVSHYFERNKLEYNYIAVTAACMMVSKEKYNLVNGFEEEFAVAFNDVDFCYKLLERGFYNVVRMDVVLLHHESISRGNDLENEEKTKRLAEERDLLYRKHPDFEDYDPFYNVNLCQDDVTFANGYTTVKMEAGRVKQLEHMYPQSEKIVCYIDTYRPSTKEVYFEGWAYIQHYKKNNDIKAKLLLYNDKIIYQVDTQKVYRPDVSNSIADEKYIEYIGFRCTVDRKSLESGEYQVGVVCNNKYADIDLVADI